ncbi:MAG TPA: c-type cytochrome, partial [Hyphomicrobiales bacterium]|nr:c-type cytochrome [Hyphomicrobiales bacterium]
SSYDPDSHLMYICATDQIGVLIARDEDEAQAHVPYADTDGFGSIDVARRGLFTAVDLSTRRIAWQQQWSDRCFSGSVVTAGGLVFVGRGDGRLTALDKRTGDQLWAFRTESGGIHGAPAVFTHKGAQYVAAFAGGSVFYPGQRGDSVWLFSLHGQMEEPPRAPATSTAALSASPSPEELMASLATDEPADLERGRLLYMQACQPCHGETGRGGEGGGAPLTAALTLETIVTTLNSGRNQMPAFGALFDPAQLRDIAHYLKDDLLEAPAARE